jgi:hypothetical protein
MNSVGGVIGLSITNHFSRITNHGRTSGPAVRFQDLLLAFLTALRVWRLAFRTPAFAKPTARQAVLVLGKRLLAAP